MRRLGTPALIGIVVVVVGVGLGIGLLTQSHTSFTERAEAICKDAKHRRAALPQTPTSIGQAMEIERGMLATFTTEIDQLRALRPPAAVAAAYNGAIADDERLLGLLRQMIARPDFIRLSITLPGHPELAPPWLKAWVAQTQSLAADSKAKFAQVPNVPDCAQTFA